MEGEEEDAPKGKLIKELDGDYRFAREQDCDHVCLILRLSEALERRFAAP